MTGCCRVTSYRDWIEEKIVTGRRCQNWVWSLCLLYLYLKLLIIYNKGHNTTTLPGETKQRHIVLSVDRSRHWDEVLVTTSSRAPGLPQKSLGLLRDSGEECLLRGRHHSRVSWGPPGDGEAVLRHVPLDDGHEDLEGGDDPGHCVLDLTWQGLVSTRAM